MPHKLHERALRLHIADVREWSETSNPWLDREDAFLVVPLMLRATRAFVDVLEYMLDTSPAAEAWDSFRKMLHQGEASLPAPLMPWPCDCSACVPSPDGVHSSPAARYLEARRVGRALEPIARGLTPGDIPTEPIKAP